MKSLGAYAALPGPPDVSHCLALRLQSRLRDCISCFEQPSYAFSQSCGFDKRSARKKGLLNKAGMRFRLPAVARTDSKAAHHKAWVREKKKKKRFSSKQDTTSFSMTAYNIGLTGTSIMDI